MGSHRTTPTEGSTIRLARAEDRPRLAEICLRTADSGEDASAQEDDPTLLGLFYVEPYVVFAPAFSFVAEVDGIVIGYAVGAPETTAFAAWLADVWLPPLRVGRVDPGPDRKTWAGSDWLRHMVHHPPEAPDPALMAYPAHGHINLLPAAQGLGLGRGLMTRLCAALADAGAGGIHLGVLPRNARALQFYAKLGFEPIMVPEDPETTYVGRSLP